MALCSVAGLHDALGKYRSSPLFTNTVQRSKNVPRSKEPGPPAFDVLMLDGMKNPYYKTAHWRKQRITSTSLP